MKEIHIFNGEKGGVGKSWVCKTAVAFHLRRKLSFAAYDADRTNANVLRAYGDVAGVKPVIFSEAEEFDSAANAIFNSAADGKRVLVNLPAQVMPALSAWIDQNDLFEMAEDAQVEWVNWFVSDGEADSVDLFDQVLDRFGVNMRHVFVANYGRTKKWDMLMSDKSLLARMKQMNVKLVRFPKFIGADDRKRIDQLALTFDEALVSDQFERFGRQHVKSFLKLAFAEFDASGLFADD